MIDARSGLLGGQVRSYLADGVARLEFLHLFLVGALVLWCLPFRPVLRCGACGKGCLELMYCDLDYAGREIVSIK